MEFVGNVPKTFGANPKTFYILETSSPTSSSRQLAASCFCNEWKRAFTITITVKVYCVDENYRVEIYIHLLDLTRNRKCNFTSLGESVHRSNQSEVAFSWLGLFLVRSDKCI